MIPVVWTMRYSVLTREKRWNINKNISFEDYRGKLFSDERMDQRHWMLSNISLPSLSVQGGQTVLNIIASEAMPSRHKRRLEDTVSGFSWVRISYVSPEEERIPFEKCLQETLGEMDISGDRYVNAGIDDDDAVSRDFSDRLRNLAGEYSIGHIISLSQGCIGVFDWGSQRFEGLYSYNSPKINLGLAVVGSFKGGTPSHSMYSLGVGHMKLDSKYRVVLDGSQMSFLRTSYPTQDTEGAIRLSRSYQSVDPATVLERFNLSVDFLPRVGDSISRLKHEKRMAFCRRIRQRIFRVI